MSGAPRCLCCRNPTDNQLLHIGFSVGNIFQTIRNASGGGCIYVYHAAGLLLRCSRFYLFLAGISDKRISLHGSGGLRDFYRLNFVSGKAARFHYRRIITGILEAYFPNLVGFKRTFTDSLHRSRNANHRQTVFSERIVPNFGDTGAQVQFIDIVAAECRFADSESPRIRTFY